MTPRSNSESRQAVHPLIVGGLLIALALLSFGLSFVQLRSWALPVALLISAAKAAIVLLAFMGFGRASASSQFAALAALLMLLLLAGLMLADPLTRRPSPVSSAETARSRGSVAHGLPDIGHGNQPNRRGKESRHRGDE